jgi:hypothetical protein
MNSKYENIDRDEATLGLTKNRKDSPKGVADEDQPIQRPPETQPEPRPATPIMSPSLNTSQSTNTNSPA